MWRSLLLIGLLLGGPLGSDAPEDRDIHLRAVRISAFLDQVELGHVAVWSGQPSLRLRSVLDVEGGNADGWVDAEEVRRYEEDHTRRWVPANQTCAELGAGLRLDERPPAGLSETRILLQNATGPVASIGPIDIHAWNRFEFASPAADRARLTIVLRDVRFHRLTFGCTPGALVDTWDNDLWRGAAIRVAPGADHALLAESMAPAELRRHWAGDALTIPAGSNDTDLLVDPVGVDVMTSRAFAALPVEPASGAGPWGWALAGGAATVLLVPPWRRATLRLLALPLYNRLRRDRLLDNTLRLSLLSRVQQSPGLSLADLERATERPRATLQHHLRILQKHGLVVCRRDTLRARYYPTGPRVPPSPYLTPLQRRFIEYVRTRPAAPEQVAVHLGRSRRLVSYHGRRLWAFGLLRIEPAGRSLVYVPNDGPSTAAQPMQAADTAPQAH